MRDLLASVDALSTDGDSSLKQVTALHSNELSISPKPLKSSPPARESKMRSHACTTTAGSRIRRTLPRGASCRGRQALDGAPPKSQSGSPAQGAEGVF
ncbi:hypothetical protein CEK25_013499 [Fusarium fujikuroi]|nr:hypothetical protein CEK25_013499 [Fusarium fujikuroi]